MELRVLTPTLAIKLGSVLVHADEISEPENPCEPAAVMSYSYDRSAIRILVEDPEVREWLASFGPGLLPEKRR